MIKAIHTVYYATHKDGSIQPVRLLYHSPDPNYWTTLHDKFLNKNVQYLKIKDALTERSIKIDKLISKFLYNSQPETEKHYLVEPLDNIPFKSDNTFYIQGKYLKRNK